MVARTKPTLIFNPLIDDNIANPQALFQENQLLLKNFSTIIDFDSAMSKIHPAEKRCSSEDDLFLKDGDGFQHERRRNPCMLTVWKRSSMTFQGTDGFTVFDTHGRLVFRVDNYSRKNRYAGGGLILMDGVGNALLTLKPQVRT